MCRPSPKTPATTPASFSEPSQEGAPAAIQPWTVSPTPRTDKTPTAKDLGETLDTGEAALVIVGESKLDEVLKGELKRATRTIEKELDADASETWKEIETASEPSAAR